MDTVSSRTREAPLVMLLLTLVPSIAVAVRVADALWLAAGAVLVMTGSSVARAILDGARPAGTPETGTPAADGPGEEDRTARWLRALVISSLLTAAFEAGLLAVAPAASAALGIYAPLLAVNLLVAGKGGLDPSGASPLRATLSSLRNGAWFAGGLVAIALAREVLGAGTITLFPVSGFGGTITLSPLLDQPVRALGFAGGGLLCLGYLVAAVRAVLARKGSAAPRAEASR